MSHLVFVETSGSGVNAISYAKQAGHTVTYLFSELYDFTASPQQRALARELADHVVELPGGRGAAGPDADGLVVAMRSAGVRPEHVDAVLCTLAFCVPQAVALGELLGVRSTSAVAVATARDKGRCRTVLRDAALPSLAFSVVRTREEALSAADDIGYPVIVKPVLGVGKGVTSIACTARDVEVHFSDLAVHLRSLPPGMAAHFDECFIVEQLAVGDLYSVEVAADGRNWMPLAATLQKTGAEDPVLELGCTTPCGLDSSLVRELMDYAVRVCRAVGLDLGIFHVEVMHTADGFRLTEVNPRMAGGALPETVNAVAGRNMFEILVDLYLGQPVPPGPLRLDGAASHSVLGAAAESTVRPDLPADWFAGFLDRLHSGWVRAEPGSRLLAMRGNFDRFGMIRAVAFDAQGAREACNAVKADIERALDVCLVPERTSRLIAA
jgi:biotin carboxylase